MPIAPNHQSDSLRGMLHCEKLHHRWKKVHALSAEAMASLWAPSFRWAAALFRCALFFSAAHSFFCSALKSFC